MSFFGSRPDLDTPQTGPIVWSPVVRTLDQIERVALDLPCSDRAKLAERLWESVFASPGSDVVMTRELDSLLDEGLEHLDNSQTTDSLRKNP
jgi:hypothetical protein